VSHQASIVRGANSRIISRGQSGLADASVSLNSSQLVVGDRSAEPGGQAGTATAFSIRLAELNAPTPSSNLAHPAQTPLSAPANAALAHITTAIPMPARSSARSRP
jgi:hypothetical protein